MRRQPPNGASLASHLEVARESARHHLRRFDRGLHRPLDLSQENPRALSHAGDSPRRNAVAQKIKAPASVVSRARHVKLIAFDVDGVLTAGDVILLNSGEEIKLWNS